MEKSLPTLNQIELRIYNCLGIRCFQKMVFLLEAMIHRRDGQKNKNYHFVSNSIAPSEQFIKYLFYNGTIHVRNIFFFLTYLAIKLIFFSYHAYDVILTLFFVKDVYCVMLQRYNYLRIKKANMQRERLRKTRIKKRVSELLPQFQEKYDASQVEADLALIRKIRQCVEDKSVIVLEQEECAALERLAHVVE